MAERVFAKKLSKAGFKDLETFGHTPYGIDEVKPYPLFPAALIEVMRQVLDPQRQRHLCTGVTLRARKPRH